MSKLFGGSIRSKVMEKVNERIDRAQALHDIEVKQLIESKRLKFVCAITEMIEKCKQAIVEYKQKKAAAEENHVNSILSKIL